MSYTGYTKNLKKDSMQPNAFKVTSEKEWPIVAYTKSSTAHLHIIHRRQCATDI